jgi:hypothetical protein
VYELQNADAEGKEYLGFCINQASRLQSYCPDLGFVASARLKISNAELEKHGLSEGRRYKNQRVSERARDYRQEGIFHA